MLSSVAHYDIDTWPHLALYSLMWPHMVFLFFPAMAMCAPIQLSMVLCDLVWSCMAFYGKISYFLAVIDPNSFGLVLFPPTFIVPTNISWTWFHAKNKNNNNSNKASLGPLSVARGRKAKTLQTFSKFWCEIDKNSNLKLTGIMTTGDFYIMEN